MVAGEPIFLTENLTSNRYDALPNETLQVVVFYDGSTKKNPQLRIGYTDMSTLKEGWITVSDIHKFDTKIETREYDLNGSVLNGKFKVSGVVRDRVIDGMAFGLYWKDQSGNYHILRSNSYDLMNDFRESDYVGAWSCAMSYIMFINRTPQIVEGIARQQAMAAIYGSKLMANGNYFIPISQITNSSKFSIANVKRNQLLEKGNPSGPIFLTENLTSNRWDALPRQTLQVVIFYDGSIDNDPQLGIGYTDMSTLKEGWITVSDIHKFDTKIETREYDLNGSVLNGKFEVSGVIRDGYVDGLAFGLYWKDRSGNYYILKSNSNDLMNGAGRSDFIVAWPYGMNDITFINRTPQIVDGIARQQAMAAIYGSKVLANGNYFFSVPQVSFEDSIKIVSPEDGTTVKGKVNVEVDVAGDFKIAQVNFYIDGELKRSITPLQSTSRFNSGLEKITSENGIGSKSNDKNFTSNRTNTEIIDTFLYEWDTTKYDYGMHTVKVIVYKISGQRLLARVKVKVDNPPEVSIIQPENGAKVKGNVNIEITAEDDDAVKKVEFFIDDELIHTDTSAPYSYTWETLSYFCGEHTIIAKAYDSENQWSSDEITVYVENIIITLHVSRLTEKVWIINKQYGKVDLMVENPHSIPVSKVVIYRKIANEAYQPIVEISSSELQGESYTYLDKYLEKDKTYTYQAEVLNPDGIVIAKSGEKTI